MIIVLCYVNQINPMIQYHGGGIYLHKAPDKHKCSNCFVSILCKLIHSSPSVNKVGHLIGIYGNDSSMIKIHNILIDTLNHYTILVSSISIQSNKI